MRLFLFLLLLGCGFASFGQLKVGLFAGPQATTAQYTIYNVKQPTTFKYGIQAGVNLKVPFENHLFFTPALYYSMLGYKVTLNHFAFPPSLFAKNNDTRIHTVEVAPLLNYDLSYRASHFFIEAGPSLNFTIVGKEKFDIISGTTVKQNMRFNFENYGFVTSAAVVRFGYEAAFGFMIFAHYEHGLGSANNADNGPIIKHRVVGISIGKYLGRNPNIIDTRNRE